MSLKMSLLTTVGICYLLAPPTVFAEEQRRLVLSAGPRGLGFLYNGSDLAGGPGAAVGLIGLGHFRIEADFSYASTSNQDDGFLLGFLLSAQYPSISSSHHGGFVGLGFSEWLMNDNTPFLRAALGYAFTWNFLFLRAAWEPHLGFFRIHCAHCRERYIELISTTLVSFSISLSFGIDLL
jgi:hypothetical protein